MRRRSRTEVIIDILTEASRGANKTRIMYRANLNFCRFNRYFSKLMDEGLVVAADNPGGIVYLTTEKGKRLLALLRSASELASL